MNKPVSNLKPEAEITAPHVLQAINSVMRELNKLGIAKDRKNTQQNYNFRGIDDVYNVLCGLLADNHLVISPKCLSHTRDFIVTGKGSQAVSAVVSVEYEFASVVDGSVKIVGPFPGEAMDYADKATNKAMSAAYKYMAMQEFCIPTEGDNDADAATHTLASAEQLAINLLRGASADRALFKDAWEKNKDGWKGVMDGPAYARVVAEMKRLAAAFPKETAPEENKPAPPPPEERPISSRAQAHTPASEDFGLNGDDIPDFD